MDEQPIKHLVIVGGGSAGWMSACYLDRVFNHPKRTFNITLVESADVGTIGVGEATVHSLRLFLASIGVTEAEVIEKTNATLKHGISFRNWVYGKGEKSDQYFHAFEQPKYNDGVSAIAHWANVRSQNGNCGRFDRSVSPQTQIALDNRSPRSAKHKEYTGFFPYGYHVDALLLGRYLRDVATQRGVKRIEGHVAEVVLNDRGGISKLSLTSGDAIAGDFFIDCTGFASLLMEKMGNTDFIDYSESLLCDRAVACQIKHDSKSSSAIRPYTTATAQGAGWIWDIDLVNRSGKGYVYSSDFCSADQAHATLADYVNQSPEELTVKHLRMKVGRRKFPWHKNCVSVGLSSGFIEPLESTGLYFIDMALRFLGEYIPGSSTPDIVVDKYNEAIGQLVDQTRDFIVLHYILTRREDTAFWKAYKHHVKPSDALAANMELWRQKVPTPADFAGQITLFSSANYAYILYGMEFEQQASLNTGLYVSAGRSKAFLERLNSEIKRAINTFPLHCDYLRKYRQF